MAHSRARSRVLLYSLCRAPTRLVPFCANTKTHNMQEHVIVAGGGGGGVADGQGYL